MIDITVIILTKNEEKNIKKCIESIRGFAKRIVVMDSFSNDRTIEIAESLGAETFQHEFKHYGAQFQYALDNCSISTKWVFRLDADEEVSKQTKQELEELCVRHNDTDVNGFVFRLEETFLGKKLHHGGLNILEKLCIFKFGKAYMEDRYMGEHIILKEGKSIKLKTVSYHNDFKDLTFWINKLNWYASREAKDYMYQIDKTMELKILDRPTKIRRFLKYNLYYRLPTRLRYKLVFLYFYYFRLGFLDGKEGYYRIYFMVYWYRMLVDAKIYESRISGKEIGETQSWD